MASTFYGLDIALSGLYASNAKLNTTSHNIANAETEGYTRQSVVTKASKALKSYSTYGMVGSGVEIDSIIQERNSYFVVKYWKSNTVSGEYGTKSYYMNSVENYFNELNDEIILDAYESGSTYRFLIPISLLSGKKVIFKGTERLIQRGIG